MKRFITLVAVLGFTISSWSQAPQMISYQAVIRNSNNQLVTSHLIGIKISILRGSSSGTVIYAETQKPTTNVNGLISIQVGAGTLVKGTFGAIDWSNGPYFLKTEVDPAGGTSYSITGTSQLISVPYAQYAAKAGNSFSGNYNDLTNKPTLYKSTVHNGTDRSSGNFQAWTDGKGSGLKAVYSFYPTFQITEDNGPRRAADIVGGFDGGAWGTEFLAFNVGSNHTANDNDSVTKERMRITDAGNVGIGITNPQAKLDVAGDINVNNHTITNLNNPVNSKDAATKGYVDAHLFSGNYNDLANKPLVKDSIAKYSVLLWGDQTIAGNKTFSSDITVNGIRVGRGKSSIVYNTAVGNSALFNNTTGNYNTAIGYYALFFNTTGYSNTANGAQALSNNTTGNYNTATGSGSLLSNTTGNNNTANGSLSLNLNTTGHDNTANGYQTLVYNTTGHYNTANGGNALSNNTTGYENVAVGFEALYYNTTAFSNTANGYRALHKNTTGNGNVAVGNEALFFNTIGYCNVANGLDALYFSTTGYYNTATGYLALNSNTSGNSNVANGTRALYTNTTGLNNTALGFCADVSYEDLFNCTAIGYSAKVNASNKVVIGNSSVTTIGGYANWSNFSDRRLKENIVYTSKLGLDFIKKLQTVSYNYTSDSLKHRRDGLIAQDVEAALNELGLQFSGLVVDDDKDKTLNLAYGDFVIPLINSVKELSKQNDALKNEVDALKVEIEKLKSK
jgi:trimeric autotransporter adhesin